MEEGIHFGVLPRQEVYYVIILCSSVCNPLTSVCIGNGPKMFVKGAPGRFFGQVHTHVRVGSNKVHITKTIMAKILELTKLYGGTGRDTLRCLALAIIDNPPNQKIWTASAPTLIPSSTHMKLM